MSRTLTTDTALTLLLRSGFQPSLKELGALSGQALDSAVTRIVTAAAGRTQADTPPPDWVGEAQPLGLAKLPMDEKRALFKQAAKRAIELRAWWFTEMRNTPAPLAERMTLFWHGHFTSSFQPVRWPQLMYRQNLLFRRHALGNYRSLLHEIARDPAMLLYLNNQQNKKSHPNENFARELMELFTLGEGHYSEHDITELARAFTGWQYDPRSGAFAFKARDHDDGIKTVLGSSGSFDGDQAIDVILAQARAAEFIIEKLWQEFVSPQADAGTVTRLAKDFRKDWDLAKLMQALLSQPAVYAPDNRGSLVKSPAEFVVGTARFLDLDLPAAAAANASRSMGQQLFNPPNVRGWPGGNDWITSDTLLARRNFIELISGDAGDAVRNAGKDAPSMADDDTPMMAAGNTPADAAEMDESPGKPRKRALSLKMRQEFGRFAETMPVQGVDLQLLTLPPLVPPDAGAKPSERLSAWLLDPVYNLK
jgi:uncharacterized protein (DUF1800 family)